MWGNIGSMYCQGVQNLLPYLTLQSFHHSSLCKLDWITSRLIMADELTFKRNYELELQFLPRNFVIWRNMQEHNQVTGSNGSEFLDPTGPRSSFAKRGITKLHWGQWSGGQLSGGGGGRGRGEYGRGMGRGRGGQGRWWLILWYHHCSSVSYCTTVVWFYRVRE